MPADYFTRSGTPVARPSFDGKGKAFHMYTPACGRCGGAGGADKWKHTGWTCYQCGGNGRGTTRAEPLYTVDQLAKLNAAQVKRSATRQAKTQAKAAAIAIEADKVRDQFAAAHPDVVAYLKTVAAPADHLCSEAFTFDQKMRDTLSRFGLLSIGQVDAIRAGIVRKAAERARVSEAKWIGDKGARVTATVTVKFSESYPGQFGGYSLVIFRDDAGNTLKSLGSFYAPKDWAGSIVATVKACERDPKTGEPVTVLFRIKRQPAADAASKGE